MRVIEGFILKIELLVLIAAAIFAGLWVSDPDGPYEPFTYSFGVVLFLIEFYRRKAIDSSVIVDEVPSDIISKLELGCPKERVRDVLGSPIKSLEGGIWQYRFNNALIQVTFDSSESIESVILARTIHSSKKGFELPWFDERLGQIKFGNIEENLEQIQHRSSLRTSEVYLHTMFGPPGAQINLSFGALRPLAAGILEDVDIPDLKKDFRIEDSKNMLINWVGYSSGFDELFLDWSLGIPDM